MKILILLTVTVFLSGALGQGDETTTPPKETTRRYSYFDEAGNYVSGYEAADGSFREEVRGLDCIVHGKYGYVDPDGIRREFTYVSGEKCDPNTEEPPVVLQGHPIGVVSQVDQPTSGNEQFLHQTAEEQLSQTALDNLNFVRRPPQPQLPVQENIVPSVRRPSQSVQRLPKSIRRALAHIREPKTTPAPAAVPTKPEFVNTPAQVSVPETTKPPVVFPPRIAPARPRHPRPVSDFNFESEFQDLFDNFADRPQVRPRNLRPSPTTAAPPPRPTTQAPRRPDPRVNVTPSRPASSSRGHQLIFDSAQGTFKTVPISNAVSTPVKAGNPLLLFSTNNPLPKVPTWGLRFGTNPTSAKEFDNYFNGFTVRRPGAQNYDMCTNFKQYQVLQDGKERSPKYPYLMIEQ